MDNESDCHTCTPSVGKQKAKGRSQVQALICTITRHKQHVHKQTTHTGLQLLVWSDLWNLPEASDFPPNEGTHTTFNVILCSVESLQHIKFHPNMSVAL